jgi:hypothetical protein
MSNKVDKLFKEKLGEHSVPPSAKAWERVEINLSKKNKTITWFRMAAAFVLVGLFTLAMIQWKNSSNERIQVAVKKDSVIQQKELQNPLAEKETVFPIEDKKTPKTKRLTKKAEQNLQSEITNSVKQEENQVAIVNEETLIVTEVESPKVSAKKTMKLIFNLPTIESKPEEMVVAAEEEKKTGLQKAFDAARDIRNGEVLGSLREAKNDLFAREFKKDKSKKQ